MAINNGIGRVWAANAGEEGRPAGVGPVWIENIDAITPSGGGGGHTYTGGNGIDVDNVNDTISLDDDTQAAINSYVTNSGSFLTSGDLNGYATEQWVQDETSAFITSADLPDLDGYATETWVSGQGYMKNLFMAEYGVTTYADIYDAHSNNKIVYCRIPTGQYGGGRMASLAYANISTPSWAGNFFEFQYYRSNSNEAYNDSVFVYQVKPDNTWTTVERTAGNVSDWNAASGRTMIRNKPDLSVYATEQYVQNETSAFVTSADIPEVPGVKDLVAGNGIDITTTSADVTISVDNDVFNGYATETWTAQNYFPIDGLQVVSSSAEASGANIIYIVSGSNQ